MERCLLCHLWKPIWKWLEEVDRLTGRRIRLGGLCRTCSLAQRLLPGGSAEAGEGMRATPTS